MARSRQKGSAAVEMIYLLLFFLAFVALYQRFSAMAIGAHRVSINLQNDIEKKMRKAERPVCLEEMDSRYTSQKTRLRFFGRPISKMLIFSSDPICEGVRNVE